MLILFKEQRQQSARHDRETEPRACEGEFEINGPRALKHLQAERIQVDCVAKERHLHTHHSAECI